MSPIDSMITLLRTEQMDLINHRADCFDVQTSFDDRGLVRAEMTEDVLSQIGLSLIGLAAFRGDALKRVLLDVARSSWFTNAKVTDGGRRSYSEQQRECIVYVMQLLGLTLQEAGDLFGVSSPTLSNWRKPLLDAPDALTEGRASLRLVTGAADQINDVCHEDTDRQFSLLVERVDGQIVKEPCALADGLHFINARLSEISIDGHTDLSGANVFGLVRDGELVKYEADPEWLYVGGVYDRVAVVKSG